MLTNGQFIRQKLLEAGDKGIVVADIHKERKRSYVELGIIYRTGTYASFFRYFYWLEQLGWVEKTGETEESSSKGNKHPLRSPRTYYRITPLGIKQTLYEWSDLLTAMHPEWSGQARSAKYYRPTGRPRGRPRKGPPVLKKRVKEEKKPVEKVKPKKVVKPAKKKVVQVMLTDEEKAEALKEFRDITLAATGKEPTASQIAEMFIAELREKRRRFKEKG